MKPDTLLSTVFKQKTYFPLYVSWMLHRMVIAFGVFTFTNHPDVFCKKGDFKSQKTHKNLLALNSLFKKVVGLKA